MTVGEVSLIAEGCLGTALLAAAGVRTSSSLEEDLDGAKQNSIHPKYGMTILIKQQKVQMST